MTQPRHTGSSPSPDSPTHPTTTPPLPDGEANRSDLFGLFAGRMRADGQPDVVIDTFRHYYRQLADGETGLVPEAAIQPLGELPDLAALDESYRQHGRSARARTVLIKLNGGLGTSMGLQRAKSLLVVKDDLTFLDIIARQALASGVPLVLMNSFATQADSLAALAVYPDLARFPAGPDFLQHRFPKVLQADLAPVADAAAALGWNPPGHGDLYTALVTRGMLGRLLSAGIDYAFVSNCDNLGAALDDRLLGYFAAHELPFLMEVADRTLADRKGGHLALRPDGRLLLRELAQCPPGDLAAFQDIQRHRYFNTNSVWLHLPTLAETLAERGNLLGLPLIRNAKRLDPRDPASPEIYQLETALGSAIGVFDGAGAIRVPRTRFAPVKTTDDLLVLRSDAFRLTETYELVPCATEAPPIKLDPQYYHLIDDFEARFPDGPPSLVNCESLRIHGDICFGAGVILSGTVDLRNASGRRVTLPAGTRWSGAHSWD